MPELEQTSREGKRRDNTSLAGLTVSFVVFVAVPYELYLLGLSLLTDFAITVFVAGFLADIFTTKIGFRRGYGDYNVLYNLASKSNKLKENAFLMSVIVFGIIRAAIAIYFWNEPIVLLIVATTSLVGPLWNSIILSTTEKQKVSPKDLNISQEIKV